MRRAIFGFLAIALSMPSFGAEYEIPLFLSADNASRSMLRIYGKPYAALDSNQTIFITGYDDQGNVHGPVMYRGGPLRIGSWGIENGNPYKGLPVGLGDGKGNWRLVLSALNKRLAVSVAVGTLDDLGYEVDYTMADDQGP